MELAQALKIIAAIFQLYAAQRFPVTFALEIQGAVSQPPETPAWTVQ